MQMRFPHNQSLVTVSEIESRVRQGRDAAATRREDKQQVVREPSLASRSLTTVMFVWSVMPAKVKPAGSGELAYPNANFLAARLARILHL